MTPRRFLLRAIIVALLAISSLSARDLPQAPAPHVKKTTAERLVGKWMLVEKDGKPIPKTGKYYLEFTADGKLRISAEDHLVPPAVWSGTYELIDDTIHFHTPKDRGGQEQRWEAKIESITDEGLAMTAKRGDLSAAGRYRTVASEK